VADLLAASLSERYDQGLISNMAHVFVRRGDWDSAARAVASYAQRSPSDFLTRLLEVVTRRDKPALDTIPFVSIADQGLVFDRRGQLSRAQMAGYD
jgi:hypothetical protein